MPVKCKHFISLRKVSVSKILLLKGKSQRTFPNSLGLANSYVENKSAVNSDKMLIVSDVKIYYIQNIYTLTQ